MHGVQHFSTVIQRVAKPSAKVLTIIEPQKLVQNQTRGNILENTCMLWQRVRIHVSDNGQCRSADMAEPAFSTLFYFIIK